VPQGLTPLLSAKGRIYVDAHPHRWIRPKRLLPPGFIVPCQPTLADKVPAGDGWIHELKHDGFRIIAHKDGDREHRSSGFGPSGSIS
jgi:bifunctional non-homologous end joining protein LigD